jgi:hypothetical protein
VSPFFNVSYEVSDVHLEESSIPVPLSPFSPSPEESEVLFTRNSAAILNYQKFLLSSHKEAFFRHPTWLAVG